MVFAGTSLFSLTLCLLLSKMKRRQETVSTFPIEHSLACKSRLVQFEEQTEKTVA